MADDQDQTRGTAAQGHRVFGQDRPGTTGGPDAATTDRPLGTTGLRAEDSPSAAELTQQMTASEPGGHADDSRSGYDDKALHELLPDLDDAALKTLAVLEPGTPLEQGGVYLDLNDLGRGPFKALGGHEAGPQNRYVAKRDTDYELWNRLAGRDDEATIERPGEGV